MKLLADVNFLLALAVEGHAHHVPVRTWFGRLPQDRTIHVCRETQSAFLRLLCSEAALGRDAITLPAAWSVYATLLASGRFSFVLEPTGLDIAWEKLCRPFGRSPKVVADAYLAAFAVAGGFRLVTLDRAFSQFPGLAFVRPEQA